MYIYVSVNNVFLSLIFKLLATIYFEAQTRGSG